MVLQSPDPKGKFWEDTALPEITPLSPGSYTNPTITVDEFGRILQASSNSMSSNIQVLDEGTPISISAFSTINFTGPGVIASDAGGGTVDVTINSSGSTLIVREEGISVPNTPHIGLNFLGNVTVSDSGTGYANVSIDEPQFTQRYRTGIVSSFGGSPQTVGLPLDKTGIIKKVIIYVPLPFTAGTTIEITDGAGNTIIPASSIDVTVNNIYILELPNNTAPIFTGFPGQEQVKAVITGSPTTGACGVEIYYNLFV